MSALPSCRLALAKLRSPSNPLLAQHTRAAAIQACLEAQSPVYLVKLQKHRGVNDTMLVNIGGTNLELSLRRHSFASQGEQPEHDLEARLILIV